MRSIMILCWAVILLSSCSKQLTEKESITEIEKLEKELFATMETPDDSLADALMTAYEHFNTQFKESELAPEYLFRAANLARSFNDYKRAIGHYEAIVNHHPDYPNIIETKFMIAFMYDNDFKDKKKAEELYKAIAAEYPDHIFGRESSKRLETLHMSDQEMLEYFKRKNGLSPDTAAIAE